MKESCMAQGSLESKLPSKILPTFLGKTKNSLTLRKIDFRLITPSSKPAQPLANLQNSLSQPFKR